MGFGKRPTWFDDAACRNIPDVTNLFFPDSGNSHLAAHAKKICDTCPVQQQCFDYSIELSKEFDIHGVWGGSSKLDRANFMAEHNITSRRVAFDVDILGRNGEK